MCHQPVNTACIPIPSTKIAAPMTLNVAKRVRCSINVASHPACCLRCEWRSSGGTDCRGAATIGKGPVAASATLRVRCDRAERCCVT